MKVKILKQPGGIFAPASDIEAEKLKKFKTGGLYEVEIPVSRNALFHAKVFAFLNFCFEHWSCPDEHKDQKGQFDCFRDNLTVLAGYRKTYYKIDGSVRVEAKSISYGAMNQDEIESYYHAIIQAAMTHIFKTDDQNTLNQLYSFF